MKRRPFPRSLSQSVEGLEPRTLLANAAFAAPIVTPVSNALLISAVDLNGDGKLDLVGVISNSSDLEYFAGNGNGTFAPAQTLGINGANGYGHEIIDMNGDSRPDVVISAFASGQTQISVFLNQGNAVFGSPVTTAVAGDLGTLDLADVNGDGRPDLVFAYTNNTGGTNVHATLTVLLSNGNGTFQPAATVGALNLTQTTSAFGGVQLVAADVNGDGHNDIFLTYPGAHATALFLGNGNGTFAPPATAAQLGTGPGITALTDLDGDGRPDLIAVDYAPGAVDIELNNGSGGFLSPHSFGAGSTTLNYTIALADFNGDGHADLALPLLADATVSILQGNGDGAFQPPIQFATGLKPLFSLTGDFNGDGKPDIVDEDISSIGESLVVLLNKTGESGALGPLIPSPAPNIPLSSAGSSIALDARVVQVDTADLNGDGKPDLVEEQYLKGYHHLNVLVGLGNGNGTYATPSIVQTITPVIAEPSASRLVASKRIPLNIVDVTGDGIPDIVTVQYSFPYSGHRQSQVVVLLGNGNGTFKAPIAQAAIPGFTRALALGDVNGDGRADVVELTKYTNRSSKAVSFSFNVLLGNGNGTFAPASTLSLPGVRPISLSLADLNGDGHLDLVSANGYYGTVSVLLNNGNGTFKSPVSYAALPGDDGLAVADLNHDGRPDIVTSDFEVDSLSIFLNTGNGTFAPQVTYTASGLPGNPVVGDVNGDGTPDLVVNSPLDNTISVLTGNGNGTFAEQQVFPTEFDPASTFLHDVNGDGKTDILVWNQYSKGVAGGIQVFLNNQPRIVLDLGVLDVVGTTASDSIFSSVANGTLTMNVNATNQSFPLSTIQQVAVFGGAGSDTITLLGFPDPATVGGAGGNDSITSGAGADSLKGGAGNDTLGGAGGNDTIVGGGGDDSLKGGAGDDFIAGGPGNDTIHGALGNDTLTGGAGDDLVNGNDGNDSIFAGSGSSQLFAGPGNDTLTGSIANGDQPDTITCGTGADSILKGAADSIVGSNASDTIVPA